MSQQIEQLRQFWGEPVFQTDCAIRFQRQPRITIRHSAGNIIGFKDDDGGRIGGPDALARMIDPVATSRNGNRSRSTFWEAWR